MFAWESQPIVILKCSHNHFYQINNFVYELNMNKIIWIQYANLQVKYKKLTDITNATDI